jgi:hypothetical protein
MRGLGDNIKIFSIDKIYKKNQRIDAKNGNMMEAEHGETEQA